MESGLPQNSVQALLQTRDGFLWLGTEAGLARFDGNGFRVFDRNSQPALPGNDIRCLLESIDGTLWIGTSEGLARWKDGTVTIFTVRDGLPANGIKRLQESGDGTLLVETDVGAARRDGDRFVSVDVMYPTAANAPASSREYRGALPFEIDMGNSTVRIDGQNAVSVTQSKNAAQAAIHLRVGQDIPGNRIQAVFADREGALWIGTNAGLVRWVKSKVERFPVTDPLSEASILELMEDREGNLWVGTENDGLHILRDQRFLIFASREGLSSDATTSVVEDSSGTLWVGTDGDGLNAVRRSTSNWNSNAVRTYSVRSGLASNVILSLAAAPNDDLWVGTPDGLNRIHNGSIKTFTSADGLPDDFIRSLLIDPDGSLWIGTRRGLAHWKLGRGQSGESALIGHIDTYTHANGLGSDLVGAMARDSVGDLWVATLAGLSRLQGNRIDNFTTADGLSSNVITALLPRESGILLIGTQDQGWNLWDGRGFSAATRNGLDKTTIHAILDDGGGHFWFATGNGLARCDYNGMSGRSPDAMCSHWIEFGSADGLRSRETASNSHPSAWRSRDGHLWFTTPKGLVEIDPAHFSINSFPPPVVLERFIVDGVEQPLLGENPTIAAGHVHFQFDYAGLSFIAPQKVRYRYMLEGFDHSWTEAGPRRAAYYTNIPPGRYTFRVEAANNDGLWSTSSSAIQFELRRHFYQTLWFYALLLLATAGAIVLLLKQRLRTARREFTAVLGERNRIAREIHDTLAQGYVGISVQLEILAELLRVGRMADAARHLDQARRYVREGLAEARQSIWLLRSPDEEATTLPGKIRQLVESAGNDGLIAEFRLSGAYRSLPAEMERELVRVAQEAVQNVKKHAKANRLFVQLEYDTETIALEVRDDGQGGAADPKVGSAPGHFGLTGMKERAMAIGGVLEVKSKPGEGTTIRLSAGTPAEVHEQVGPR